jgi:hypothetical protein
METKKQRSKRIKILYIAIPLVIVGHEIIVDIFMHYAGSVGLNNTLNWNTFISYLHSRAIELCIVLLIALTVVLIIEILINELKKR